MIDFSQTDEQKALIETARRFTKERIIPVAAEADRESRFPMQVFKDAWEIGLVNTSCPAEYGGPGMGEVIIHVFAHTVQLLADARRQFQLACAPGALYLVC